MKKKTRTTVLKDFDQILWDKEIPIKMKLLKPIIDQIAIKYPTFKKYEIQLIVKTLLEEIRAELVQGSNIKILGLMSDMRLYSYGKVRNDKFLFNVRVQMETPTKIKNVKF